VHVHGDGGFLRYGPNFLRTFYGTAALELRHARTLKGKLAQRLSYWLERREARRCRLSVGISPHIAAHLPGVTRVVPCMLGAIAGAEPPGKTPFPSLIYLGSLRSRKRGEAALELFRSLRRKHPGLRLSYVGPAAETARLKRQPAWLGVDFHSGLGQEELDDLYRRSWIYLCLSSYEGFGVGIIEAMAFSCLVVTAPHPGSEYLVSDGENGLLAPPREEEAVLARALEDAGMRRRLTAAARQYSRRFEPRAVAERYLELYRSLPGLGGEAP
jgi:glycosyltransferase involved in cell wall biosynthesis